MIETGTNYTQSKVVELKDTAFVYGSGKLEVFATPALAAFMENTAVKCLEGLLDAGTDTVGIEINIQHIKATAVGKTVSCKATVVRVEGRKIGFDIEAWDEAGKIGQATHDRFIIDPHKFMSKIRS